MTQHYPDEKLYTHAVTVAGRFLEQVVHLLVDVLYKMPLAQGVIVFMAFSLALGTLTYSNIEIIAFITQGISFFVVMSVGCVTLWLLKHDRRKQKSVLEIAVILLMLTNVLYLFDISPVARNFLYDVVSLVLMLALFFSEAHGFYEAHPELRFHEKGKDDE